MKTALGDCPVGSTVLWAGLDSGRLHAWTIINHTHDGVTELHLVDEPGPLYRVGSRLKVILVGNKLENLNEHGNPTLAWFLYHAPAANVHWTFETTNPCDAWTITCRDDNSRYGRIVHTATNQYLVLYGRDCEYCAVFVDAWDKLITAMHAA